MRKSSARDSPAVAEKAVVEQAVALQPWEKTLSEQMCTLRPVGDPCWSRGKREEGGAAERSHGGLTTTFHSPFAAPEEGLEESGMKERS